MEVNLLARLAAGDTSRQAATALKITVRTLLEIHLRVCRQQLGVREREWPVLIHTAYTTAILPHPGPAAHPLTVCADERRLWLLVATTRPADIAPVLGVSTATVRNRINRLRTRVGARSDAHLVSLGHLHGLLGCADICAAAPGTALAYSRLTEPAAALLRQLAGLPDECVVEPGLAAALPAALRDDALSIARRLLKVLAEEDLLTEHTLPRPSNGVVYRLTGASRAYARARSAALPSGSDSGNNVLWRACDWYATGILAAHRRLVPDRLSRRDLLFPPPQPVTLDDCTEARAWLLTHRDALAAVFVAAGERGRYEVVWTMAEALTPLFAPYDDGVWTRVHQPGLDSARKAGDSAAVRRMLHCAALGHSAAGQIDDAYDWYLQLLEAAAAAGDPRDQGQALWGRGLCQLRSHRPGDAEASLQQARKVWIRSGHLALEQVARLALAETALAAGDIPCAVRILSGLIAEPGDHNPAVRARARALRGLAHALRGNTDAGARDLLAALTFFETVGDIPGQARVHALISAIAPRTVWPLSAVRYARRATSFRALVSPPPSTGTTRPDSLTPIDLQGLPRSGWP
ncbi:hypothetical protein AB0P17_24490 [Streptomyces sp. NPDC088124]|uniref:helix-turn-helix transcriptional regulator n=1 Tax=Streptomyces sp. NPDC088124 TaxID=3154654 RepID=UPI00342CE146